METKPASAAETALSSPAPGNTGAPGEVASPRAPGDTSPSPGSDRRVEAPPKVRKVKPGVSEKAVSTDRQNAARAQNLEIAREKKAEKAAAGETGEVDKKKPDPQTLADGARVLVRFLWLLSDIGAFFAGGALKPLEDGELNAGAREALPLIRRVPLLVTILSVLGFPLWLGRTVREKFQRNAEKPQPEKKPEAPPEKKPLAVVPTSAGGAQ